MRAALMAAGVLLALLLERMWFVRHWDRGLSVDFGFARSHAREGSEGTLVQVVENRGRLPLPSLLVRFETGRGLVFPEGAGVYRTDRSYAQETFCVGSGERITRRRRFTCAQRGCYRVLKVSLEAGDLTGLDRGRTERAQQARLFVLPRRLPLSGVTLPLERVLGEVRSSRRIYEDPFSFAGIRPYQPTDSYRRINWRSSARTGELMVSEWEHTADRGVLLLLGLEDPGARPDPELFEDAIRLAGTMAELLLERRIGVGLVTTARDALDHGEVSCPVRAGSTQMADIDEALCRIDLEQERPPLSSWQGRIPELCRQAPVLCLISPCQSEELRGFAAQLAAGSGALLWLIPMRHRTAVRPMPRGVSAVPVVTAGRGGVA